MASNRSNPPRRSLSRGAHRVRDDARRDLRAEAAAPSEEELSRRIDQYDRASEWSGPIGMVAAGTVFVGVVLSTAVTPRLIVWSVALALAAVVMFVGLLTRERVAIALPGYALAGLVWGMAPLIYDTAGRNQHPALWIALAFQFAVTAGVLGGTNVDDRPARVILVTMWFAAAASLLVIGRPWIALGAAAFAVLVHRDLRLSSTMVAELRTLRARAAEQARRAAQEAHSDPMTGLLNRAGVERELIEGTGFGAAMFVDLDRFKEINDRLGHHVGDRVLEAVGRRLAHLFRSGDLVARIGGDEFLVVLRGTHHPDRLLERGREVISVLEEPVELDGELVLCSASVGVAPIGSGGATLEQILRESDHAMYRAKRGGRRRAVMFGSELRAELDQRAELIGSLRSAVRDQQIDAWGQPVFCLETGKVLGVELLARWQHHRAEWLSAENFLPIAVEIGLSADITTMMVRRAQELLDAAAGSEHFDDAWVSVNVAGADMRDDWLRVQLPDIIDPAQRARRRLMIEVTDSAELGADPAACDVLDWLHQIGVRLALDEFGAGYSTLASIVQRPFEVVKLDRSLTQALGAAGQQAQVIRAVVALAGAIDREVIAVGVGDVDHLAVLTRSGIRAAQGFALCPPMPFADLLGSPGRDAVDQAVALVRGVLGTPT